MMRHYNEDSNAGTRHAANVDAQYQLIKNGQILEDRLFAKERLMIIAYAFVGHYVARPCFSFNDMGLDRKKPNQRREYIPIGGRTSPEHPENEPYQGLYPSLGVQTIYEDIYNTRERSVVHFTSPVSIRFTRRVMIAGKLWPDSLIKLWELYSQSQRVPVQGSGPPTPRDLQGPFPTQAPH
jgi:hypothetical protein